MTSFTYSLHIYICIHYDIHVTPTKFAHMNGHWKVYDTYIAMYIIQYIMVATLDLGSVKQTSVRVPIASFS